MEFFDDLKQKVTVTGKQAADKVKELTDVVRMKAQISSEKSTVTAQYGAIGKKLAEHPSESDEERFAGELAVIRAAEEKIAELEAQVSKIEGTVICPTCGAKVEKSDAFCSKCGTKIEHVEESVAEKAEEILEEAAEKAAEAVEEVKAKIEEAAE